MSRVLRLQDLYYLCGIGKSPLPSTVHFAMKSTAKDHQSPFLYWDWFLEKGMIGNRKCYKSMFLWLATSESWWISMGLRSLTIGKMLEDQSGRQQAQWGSPVRAVWFVLLMRRSCCATNGVLIRRKCSWVVIACSCVTCLHNPWTWVFFCDVMVATFNTMSPKPLHCWPLVALESFNGYGWRCVFMIHCNTLQSRIFEHDPKATSTQGCRNLSYSHSKFRNQDSQDQLAWK